MNTISRVKLNDKKEIAKVLIKAVDKTNMTDIAFSRSIEMYPDFMSKVRKGELKSIPFDNLLLACHVLGLDYKNITKEPPVVVEKEVVIPIESISGVPLEKLIFECDDHKLASMDGYKRFLLMQTIEKLIPMINQGMNPTDPNGPLSGLTIPTYIKAA